MGQSHQKRRSVYGNSVIAFMVLLIPPDMAVFGGAKPIISLYDRSKVSNIDTQAEHHYCKSALNTVTMKRRRQGKGKTGF